MDLVGGELRAKLWGLPHPTYGVSPQATHPTQCHHQDSIRLPPHLLPCHAPLDPVAAAKDFS